MNSERGMIHWGQCSGEGKPHSGRARRIWSCLLLSVMLLLVSLLVPACRGKAGETRARGAGAAPKDALVLPVQGRPGGRLVYVMTAEAKSFNWVTANDASSRQVTFQILGDLIHVNRLTQQVEPALAKSWEASPDGTMYTLHLREGVKFSDGQPFTVEDVLFTFQVYQDPKVNSTQRALLNIDGKPLKVEKIDSHTVRFIFPRSHGPALRAFDEIGILPRHILEKAYQEGRLDKVWTLAEDPRNIVGVGPFRVQKVIPGQHIILERNPYYWKVDSTGMELPYLDELDFEVVPDLNAATLQLMSGAIDILDKVLPDDYETLKKSQAGKRYVLINAGPSLEYLFLVLNQNTGKNPANGKPAVDQERLRWFTNPGFRRALSHAIDRSAIVNLVYQGTARPIFSQTSPGNKIWYNPQVSQYPFDLGQAKALLAEAGFRLRGSDGSLLSPSGARVAFTLITNADNLERTKIANMIQADLGKLGIRVQLQSMEFNALVGKLLQTRDYEAAIMGLGGGDSDPGGEMNVWLSGGALHLWHEGEESPATPWEARIDELMKHQMSTTDLALRERDYAEVQKIVSEQLPIIPLVSRDILVAASDRVGNITPAVMAPYTLWNSDQLYLRR